LRGEISRRKAASQQQMLMSTTHDVNKLRMMVEVEKNCTYVQISADN